MVQREAREPAVARSGVEAGGVAAAHHLHAGTRELDALRRALGAARDDDRGGAGRRRDAAAGWADGRRRPGVGAGDERGPEPLEQRRDLGAGEGGVDRQDRPAVVPAAPGGVGERSGPDDGDDVDVVRRRSRSVP